MTPINISYMHLTKNINSIEYCFFISSLSNIYITFHQVTDFTGDQTILLENSKGVKALLLLSKSKPGYIIFYHFSLLLNQFKLLIFEIDSINANPNIVTTLLITSFLMTQ